MKIETREILDRIAIMANDIVNVSNFYRNNPFYLDDDLFDQSSDEIRKKLIEARHLLSDASKRVEEVRTIYERMDTSGISY